MSWRETFTEIFGPGLFGGTSFGPWLELLGSNRFAVHPLRIPRLISTSINSMVNSLFGWSEVRKYGSQIELEKIHPPLFILGHWRSGTTHLHNLLARDNRFAFPNLYQVLYPKTFLTTEVAFTRWMSKVLPKTRMGLDNVRLRWNVPYEDEFATAATSFRSPYLTLAFPRRRDHYDRFLTFQEASRKDIEAWQGSLIWFLKKLTWKYQKPLVLKSPTHTCRIRMLLEIFPEAKFVHLRRHPLAVFRSMKRMVSVGLKYWNLQSHRSIDWDQRIIQQYREMYDIFFHERSFIPAGHFHELSYEALESNPIEEVRKIYKALSLPDFSCFEIQLQGYLNSIKGYRKNVFPELSQEIRNRLAKEWSRCFEEWGYEP